MAPRRIVLSLLAIVACGNGPPPRVSEPEPTAPAPSWCSQVEAALGANATGRGFECLEVPNFLVTGFYGPRSNPERSDFINGCFAGKDDAAQRLRMTVRPAGSFGFSYRVERKVDYGGNLDLGFLGPWAPKLQATRSNSRNVVVEVELRDAEIRVLSSVAEILKQEYESLEPDSSVAEALEACMTGLCAKEDEEQLVYTAKVLAAVPVIHIRLSSNRERAGGFSLAAGAAGFELAEEENQEHSFELRAKEKLNVAAMLEDAEPALERAATCQSLRNSRARRKLERELRSLGLQTLAARGMESVPDKSAELRSMLEANPKAFTPHETRDLLKALEALEGASRDLGRKKPDQKLCATRDLAEAVLTGDGNENQLHDLLTDVAQPLHQRLTDLANEHDLPCADPAFYRDQDGDGYGDPKEVVRAPKPPPGYVANSLDCYDHNADARPGQRKFFARQRGDASYDYDCDGKETPETRVIAGGCKAITRFGIPIECWAEAGWREKSPGCGRAGRWLAVCKEGMLSCDEGPNETRRQTCH